MVQVRDSWHLNLSRNCHLLFDMFRGVSRPLGDDVDIVVGDIRIRLNREVVERDRSPGKEQKGNCQNNEAVAQREVDEFADHCPSNVDSSWRTLETSCWPGVMPESISCLLPASILPP